MYIYHWFRDEEVKTVVPHPPSTPKPHPPSTPKPTTATEEQPTVKPVQEGKPLQQQSNINLTSNVLPEAVKHEIESHPGFENIQVLQLLLSPRESCGRRLQRRCYGNACLFALAG